LPCARSPNTPSPPDRRVRFRILDRAPAHAARAAGRAGGRASNAGAATARYRRGAAPRRRGQRECRVARAAFFPAVTLSAALGNQSTQAGNWLSAPNAFWSVGPSLLFTLFDAGKRKAQVAQAQAALDESGSLYRGVVLTAFQQVEDSLALTHHYGIAASEEHSAVTAAQRRWICR